MSKYRNKDGIELSITSNDPASALIREVIREACKILNTYNRYDEASLNRAIYECDKFLKENFDLICKHCNRADHTCGCREEIK